MSGLLPTSAVRSAATAAADRARIADDVAAFVAAGNKIETVPVGTTGLKFNGAVPQIAGEDPAARARARRRGLAARNRGTGKPTYEKVAEEAGVAVSAAKYALTLGRGRPRYLVTREKAVRVVEAADRIGYPVDPSARAEVAAMPPDRTVTAKDVATEAHVSIATVYAAFRNAGGVSARSRDRVLAAARRLGWSPRLTAQS